MKQVLLAAVLGCAVLVPALARAQGPYLGLGAARVDTPFNKSKTAPKLFGGVDLNDKYGIEFGFTRLPATSFITSSAGAPAPYSTTRTFRSNTMYVAGKATFPVTDKFGVVAKFGLAHTRSRASVFVTPAALGQGSASQANNTGLYASFGLTYQVTDKVSVGVDVERNGRKAFQDAKPQSVSINANYRF